MAEKCLITLQEHLTKNSNLLFEDVKTMSKGIIEELPLNENVQPETIHYFPQRAVPKSERETAKVRVLFDVFWKQPDEPSLKDLLYAGPCLLLKLYEILLYFRYEKIALVADIKQAFPEMKVNQSHQDFLQFLWYKSVTADNPNKVAFRFT